jgi:hypothetical protein
MTTRILFQPEGTASAMAAKPWLWPLPRLDGVAPCIVSPPDWLPADGIQLGYPDRASSLELVPVFAPTDGAITYAARSEHGGTLCVDHPGGFYTGTLLVPQSGRPEYRVMLDTLGGGELLRQQERAKLAPPGTKLPGGN